MNIINKVTIRHLKQNKRRSLVTIIGVIISVAMITAVATLGVSFLDLMVRQEIEKNGEWHVQYKNVTEEQIEAIEQDSGTQNMVFSSDGYSILEGSQNDFKPYLYFKNYDEEGMEQFPITVSEGRLPTTKEEVAISDVIQDNVEVPFEIGDELTVEVGERVHITDNKLLSQMDSLQTNEGETLEKLDELETKNVTIVGVIDRPAWEPAWSPGYTVIGYVDKATIAKGETLDVFVTVAKLESELFDHADELADKNGIVGVQFNSELLRYYGLTDNDNLRATLFSLAGIIMAVILIGSVALIYNAFAISVSERARHLGMLSSVGATKKQKRNSVFFEGAVIGIISIPIGLLAGLGGIGLTFVFINPLIEDALNITEKLELVITPASLILACSISILTIFISSYVPAKRASKISAIDAMRQTQDIKLVGKNVKTSKWVRKVFGLEAEIGLKNVKRNRKRYLATVFSLVISIVLFLSVTYFTDGLKKSLEMSQTASQFDLQISGSGLDEVDLEIYAQLEQVTKTSLIKSAQAEAFIESDQLPGQLTEQLENGDMFLEDEKFRYYVDLQGIDDASFEAYAKELGIEGDTFAGNRKAIVIDQTSYEDADSGKFIETKTINAEVGNEIELQKILYSETNEQLEGEMLSTFEIAALTDQVPMGVQEAGLGGLTIIIPKTTFEQLDFTEDENSTSIYATSSDPMATQAMIEEQNDNNIQVYNIYQQRQQEEQMILLMSVFIYGFITLISLISIANIFNTISTSISLRKREFAMLRSVGMTPKGFNKMIRYESLFYGGKALAYGLPISIAVMIAMHRSLGYTFQYEFSLPWMSIFFTIVVIFLIVGAAMLYSIIKIKNANIIESLKQENA
ncbi:putative ABC transport system permease protein [Planomicrobium stackebrandtii]|uniref:ABC transport system permease protein n=1 Tax=Planomicrobium stackebrandtii TaxID=253160 RepID=A0ABU0GRK1_9BACL|nr:FtsX-like permease family protein [Planomicrobium stackebrandtii]MDQ0427192.1 putative ABC transport system permease protein [Planomicrobium stackebrandtii]